VNLRMHQSDQRPQQNQRVFSITLVCLVVGMITVGIAAVSQQFLLAGSTSANESPIGIPVPEIEAQVGGARVDNPDTAAATDDADSDDASDSGHVSPSNLRIPRLDVDADVEHVGWTEDGNMDSPENWEDVAWFQYGYFPGAPGNAVIAGHLDSTTGPAVFAYLHMMEVGDEIYVTGDDGRTLTFQVTEVESVLAEEAPLDRVFGPSDTPKLNLITCEGHYDPDEEDYDHRLIVYTELVDS
jgi:LPXTG-site transpeptidase (sortase) family protein